jgi:hypothetical protein
MPPAIPFFNIWQQITLADALAAYVALCTLCGVTPAPKFTNGPTLTPQIPIASVPEVRAAYLALLESSVSLVSTASL